MSFHPILLPQSLFRSISPFFLPELEIAPSLRQKKTFMVVDFWPLSSCAKESNLERFLAHQRRRGRSRYRCPYIHHGGHLQMDLAPWCYLWIGWTVWGTGWISRQGYAKSTFSANHENDGNENNYNDDEWWHTCSSLPEQEASPLSLPPEYRTSTLGCSAIVL